MSRWEARVCAEFKNGLCGDHASFPDAFIHRQLRMVRLEICERAQKRIPGTLHRIPLALSYLRQFALKYVRII